MKKFLFLVSLVFAFCLNSSLYVFSDNSEKYINIVIQSVGNYIYFDKEKDDIIAVKYRVENQGYGTLYYLSIYGKAYDDRGEEMDIYAFNYINPFNYKDKAIKIGESIEGEINIEGNKKFLKKLVITKIYYKYFNMRNLPENADLKKMVKISSEVKGLAIEFADSVVFW